MMNAGKVWELLTETGGVLPGAWFAQPPMRFGHELIAAGLLRSGPIDRDQLEHCVQVGGDGAGRSLQSYEPGRWNH